MNDIKDFKIEDGVLLSYNGEADVVIVPDSVRFIESSAFKGNNRITSVILHEGLKRIGNEAFKGCESLASVRIPGSVTSIGEAAFSGCYSLRDVNIPKSTVNIGRGIFEYCPFLRDDKGFVVVSGVLLGYSGADRDIVIPDTVKRTCDDVFYRNMGADKIAFPDSLEALGRRTLRGCRRLKELILPQGLSRFEGTVLEEIWLQMYGSRVENIMMTSFVKQYPELLKKNPALKRKIASCRYGLVKHIIFFDDVRAISNLFGIFSKIPLEEVYEYIEISNGERRAFGCTGFLLDYKNSHYTQLQQENAEQRKLDKELGERERSVADWKKLYTFRRKDRGIVITGYIGTDENLVIPSRIGRYDVTEIGKKAFAMVFDVSPDGRVMVSKQKIKSVVIPDSVTRIDINAFSTCTYLESITVPPSVKSIAVGVFHMCPNVVIYGAEGSIAQKYAEEHRIRFETVI